MTTFLKILNWIVVLIQGIICALGTFYKDISFGAGLGDMLWYGLMYGLFFTHLILTITSRKNGLGRHLILTVFFLFTTTYICLKASVWRGREYRWNGEIFYNDNPETRPKFYPGYRQDNQPNNNDFVILANKYSGQVAKKEIKENPTLSMSNSNSQWTIISFNYSTDENKHDDNDVVFGNRLPDMFLQKIDSLADKTHLYIDHIKMVNTTNDTVFSAIVVTIWDK